MSASWIKVSDLHFAFPLDYSHSACVLEAGWGFMILEGYMSVHSRGMLDRQG